MTSAMHENPKIISHLLPKGERNANNSKIYKNSTVLLLAICNVFD